MNLKADNVGILQLLRLAIDINFIMISKSAPTVHPHRCFFSDKFFSHDNVRADKLLD